MATASRPRVPDAHPPGACLQTDDLGGVVPLEARGCLRLAADRWDARPSSLPRLAGCRQGARWLDSPLGGRISSAPPKSSVLGTGSRGRISEVLGRSWPRGTLCPPLACEADGLPHSLPASIASLRSLLAAGILCPFPQRLRGATGRECPATILRRVSFAGLSAPTSVERGNGPSGVARTRLRGGRAAHHLRIDQPTAMEPRLRAQNGIVARRTR